MIFYKCYIKLQMSTILEKYHYCSQNSKCKISLQSNISTVYVICKIENEYYILIHKRSKVMTHPFEYSSQGGSIDVHKGENSYQAAIRELKEEAGYNSPPDGYLFFTSFQQSKQNFKIANYIFFDTKDNIINGVKGPLPEFANEIDLSCEASTFNDLKDSIPIKGTGHCLMNMNKNLNHPNHYFFFNVNCKFILKKLVR